MINNMSDVERVVKCPHACVPAKEISLYFIKITFPLLAAVQIQTMAFRIKFDSPYLPSQNTVIFATANTSMIVMKEKLLAAR